MRDLNSLIKIIFLRRFLGFFFDQLLFTGICTVEVSKVKKHIVLTRDLFLNLEAKFCLVSKGFLEPISAPLNCNYRRLDTLGTNYDPWKKTRSKQLTIRTMKQVCLVEERKLTRQRFRTDGEKFVTSDKLEICKVGH